MPRAHIRVQLNVMRLTRHCWTGQVTSVCCFINSLLKEPCIHKSKTLISFSFCKSPQSCKNWHEVCLHGDIFMHASADDKLPCRDSCFPKAAALRWQALPTSRPNFISLRFGLQNPFSIRARCSKDPECLAVSALRLTSQDKWKHKGGGEGRVQREKGATRSCAYLLHESL